MSRHIRGAVVCFLVALGLGMLLWGVWQDHNHPCLASHLEVSYHIVPDGEHLKMVEEWFNVCDKRG